MNSTSSPTLFDLRWENAVMLAGIVSVAGCVAGMAFGLWTAMPILNVAACIVAGAAAFLGWKRRPRQLIVGGLLILVASFLPYAAFLSFILAF